MTNHNDKPYAIDALFINGLRELNLDLAPAARDKLIAFLQFLQKWNQSYNLTAITDLKKMLSYHVLDSLSIAPFIQGDHILDVGSGAGFPGIPLAVYFPQKRWILLDSNGKKARFLIQAKAEFKLDNIEVVNERVETWSNGQRFDTIITRAVGSIPELIQQTQSLLAPGGCWLFMKGALPHDELSALTLPSKTHTLSVPGVDAARHLIVVINF